MRILQAILWSFLLVTPQCIYAQNYVNLLNARYDYLPPTSLTDSNQQIGFYELRIETTLPIELKNGNILGIKPSYTMYSLKTDHSEFRNLQLHSMKVPFFIFWKLGNSNWSSYIDISPKLNSDLKNISGRHFQIGGTAIMYLEKRKDLVWQFGLFYNQDTYGPFFMPLFGLYYVKENSYFEVLLPAYILYEKKLSPKFYTGFELQLRGETFRLGDSQYENSFISQLGENKLTFLTEPRLFVDFYMTKHLVFYIKPGIRLFHKYEHYTEDDQRIEDSEFIQGILKNSFFINIGLALRVRYDEE